MYAVTPDDATTKTDDTPRLITTEVPDSPSGLDDGPIGEESPDANDRNPFSPRSDVSGDPLDLEQGLPDDAPIFKGARNEGDDEYLPLSTLRQATAARNLRTAAAPTPDAASLTMTEVTKRLRSLGFRIRSTGERDQAIRAFKTGWFKLGPSLMDGTVANSILGPKASKAIDLAYERDKDGLTTMSPHFSFIEARCKCGGNFTDCRRIWPTRQSVIAAEALRTTFFPRGLTPVSWCRCTGHNRYVGGASSSRHLKGDAIDIPHTVSLRRIKTLGIFTGIGINRGDGNAQHVDLRPGSATAPTVWYYA
ncbi:D-Ala-D-Ala carboxypeptidase family metallohydrolase [Kineosporia rhizophila]|uniref:D-Ala-D-Ala carboxypeptidase family metallohydrolase n=1 Tax=Kineosporia rhizophila TaxID=84633 RepID=UPI001E62C562|nr:D-Ala-D-Ala carboxypeptidase family metallohydrolase [Kineosporia rhizophila]MCE0537383.1 D-Ala-D-Ala carboxypeptidase family metallohydrolase [Kineosporia rhizophila]